MRKGFILQMGRVAPYVVLTVAILLAAVRVSTASVSERQLRGAVVTQSYLPVRSAPTMVTATIAQLFQGDDVTLTGVRSVDGAWVQVKMAGVEAGWIPVEAIRVRFPIGDLHVTNDPALAVGQKIGAVAVVTTQQAPVLEDAGSTRRVMAQLPQGEKVVLAGYRTAGEKWVQVLLPDNRTGWLEAGSISSDYPLSALIEIDGANSQ